MAASARLDGIERLLAERGHDLGPVRVATGRSGVAVGFPHDPLLHVSWAVLAGAGGFACVVLLRKRRRRG